MITTINILFYAILAILVFVKLRQISILSEETNVTICNLELLIDAVLTIIIIIYIINITYPIKI